MAFGRGVEPREEVKQVVIKRTIEVPTFKDVIVERPVYVDKPINVPRVVYKDVEIQRPVYMTKDVTNVSVKEVEKVVEVPRYVEIIVEVPKYVEKIVEVPKYVENIVTVDKVEVIPKVFVHEIPITKEIPKIVEKDFFVDRPKFREKIVDVIKPRYVCQRCHHSVD